jgi:hypothetical protein
VGTERVLLADLHPDPLNRNTHGERNLGSIQASLVAFGQQKPLVVDHDNVIRAGNGTYLAAIRAGWVAIDIVRTDLVGTELRLYAVADNRTAALAEPDYVGLAEDFRDWQEQGVDQLLLDASGWDQMERETMVAADWSPKPSSGGPPHEQPGAKIKPITLTAEQRARLELALESARRAAPAIPEDEGEAVVSLIEAYLAHLNLLGAE